MVKLENQQAAHSPPYRMPRKEDQSVTIVDGSLDFSGGVNSYLVPTIQSLSNPNGLKRNQVSWMDNGTFRGGGITQRAGWIRLGAIPEDATGIYQGTFPYEPEGANPYFITVINGSIWKIDPDNSNSAVNLSTIWNLSMPADLERVYFCQAEMFLIIQANDGVTLPLFWDGSILRRSRGLLGNNALSSSAIPTLSVTLTNVDATPGYVFPAQTGSSNPLGVPYQSFTAPGLALTVVVSLGAAFAGHVGDTITFPTNQTGQMHLDSVQVVNPNFYLYNYKNLSIPPGTNVPAQFDPVS